MPQVSVEGWEGGAAPKWHLWRAGAFHSAAPYRRSSCAHRPLAAGALPAKAGGAAPTAKPPLKQPAAAQRTGRDGVASTPSFAAAAAAAPTTGGLLSGLAFKAASAAASALRQRVQGSPSFAAAPVWGKPAAPAAPRAAAQEQAATAVPRPQVPPGVASHPLYRWAKLGDSGSTQAAKPTSKQQDLAAGLGRYARQAASKPAAGAASAAAKPASMAALLRLAKLAK